MRLAFRHFNPTEQPSKSFVAPSPSCAERVLTIPWNVGHGGINVLGTFSSPVYTPNLLMRP
jgi:hypothetical protein